MKNRSTAATRTIIIGSIFFISAVLPCAAFADVIGKITALQGNVEILKPGMEGAPAKLEQPVSEGDIIQTKSNSKAEITFNDSSVIRIAPQSRLEIAKYLVEGGERKSGVLNLFTGKMRAIVSKTTRVVGASFSDRQDFQVQTPTAIAGVRGTDFFVFHINDITGILVIDGRVDTFNIQIPDKVVAISAGNATFIKAGEAPQPAIPATDAEIRQHTADTEMNRNRGTTAGKIISISDECLD